MEENKNITGVIDNLNTPSKTDETPLFSLKNYFKPTSKNFLVLGDILVSLGALVGASAIAALSTPIAVTGMVISGLGIILQRLTKEEPTSTIARAVEDIQVDEIDKTNDSIKQP